MNPKWVVHDRWVGCCPYVGLSVSDELVASDSERLICFCFAVALEKFTGIYLGGRHGVIGFCGGTYNVVFVWSGRLLMTKDLAEDFS